MRSTARPSPETSISHVGALALGLLIAVATWISIAYGRVQGEVAMVWVVNGMLVGVALIAPRRDWPRLFLIAAAAMLLVRGLYGDTIGLALFLTAVNLLESGLVAGTVRHFVPDIREPAALPQLARVATGITLFATLLSASIVAPWYSARSGAPVGEVWNTWFGAHLLGLVITATITVTGIRLKGRVLGHPGRRLDLAACLALLALTCVAIGYALGLPALFLGYLPLMLVTYRHGFAGVVTGIAVLTLAGGVGVALGPLLLTNDRSVHELSVLLQVYIGAACLLTFPTAVALSERRRLATRLNAVADNMPAMIAHFDGDERVTYANATLGNLLGLEPAQMLRRTMREVLGETIYAGMADHVEHAKSGEPQTFEGSVVVRGRAHDHSTRFIPDRRADGRVHGFYGLAFNITALKQAQRELEQLARFDALTGLPNRRHFDEDLEQACARAQRNGSPLMLLALDVDTFKEINDTHGHAVGDAVLRAVATRIRECAYEVDLAARLGGDEFVVLVEYSPEAKVGEALAERILASMREPVVVGELVLSVSTSIGIGIMQSARECDRLLELADAALYDAKSAGRNGWRLRAG